MIYVEEKSFKRQIKLLAFIANNQNLEICAWLYPESDATEIAGYEVTDNPLFLKPITTYRNGILPRCTVSKPATLETISSFGAAYTELVKQCDSLALYEKGLSSWVAATIGHEGVCLVKNETLLKGIIQAGFAASTKEPLWW